MLRCHSDSAVRRLVDLRRIRIKTLLCRVVGIAVIIGLAGCSSEKYKAQAVTKTFFHRAGDVLSGFLVLFGSTFFAFKLENYAMVNVVVAMLWIGVGVLIFKHHKALSAARL